jgi:hypothetical protein
MKRNNSLYAVVSAVTLWGLLFLAGCSNVLITPPQDTKGKVTISVNGGGAAARTLYPDAKFSSYELSFTPKSGQEGHDNVPLTDRQTSAVIDLADGEWEVTAVGFVEIWVRSEEILTQKELPAAEGTQTLHAGEPSLSISISATQEGDDGYFSWNVTFPSNKVDKASLRFTNGVDLDSVVENLIDNPAGQLKVAPGYYLVQVLLENDYQQAGLTEVVHIYSNMETRADYPYTDEDFTDFITLGGKATVTLNGNPPETAYIIALSSPTFDYSNYLGDAEINLSDGSWSIHLLPLESPTDLYFWVAVNGDEGYFEKYAESIPQVSNTDNKDNNWTISFSTITLSGTVDAKKNNGARPDSLSIRAYANKGSTDKGDTGELGWVELENFADDSGTEPRDWSIAIPDDYTGSVYFLISFYDEFIGTDAEVWSTTTVTLQTPKNINLGVIKQKYTTLSGFVDAEKRDGTRPNALNIWAYTDKDRTEQLGEVGLNGFADSTEAREWSITIPGNPNEVYFLISFDDYSSGMGSPTELWSDKVVTLASGPTTGIDLGTIKQPTTILSGNVSVTANGRAPNSVQIQAYTQEDSENGYDDSSRDTLGLAYADAGGEWSITIDPLRESTKVKFLIEVQENPGDNFVERETGVVRYVQSDSIPNINLGPFSFTILSGTIDFKVNNEEPEDRHVVAYATPDRSSEELGYGWVNKDGKWAFDIEPFTALTTVYFWVQYRIGDGNRQQKDTEISETIPANVGKGGINLGSIAITTVTLSGTVSGTVNGTAPDHAEIFAFNDSDNTLLGEAGAEENGTWSMDIESFKTSTTVKFIVAAIKDGSYLVIPLDASYNKTVPASAGLLGINLTGLSITSKPLNVRVTGNGDTPVFGQVFATSAKITAAELINQSFYLKILGGVQGSGSLELPVPQNTASFYFFIMTDSGYYTSRTPISYTTEEEIQLNLSELEEISLGSEESGKPEEPGIVPGEPTGSR